MKHSYNTLQRCLATAAGVIALWLVTGNAWAQTVTDPSNSTGYDQMKASSVPADLQGGGATLRTSGGPAPSTQLPACFVPLDGSFTSVPRNDDGSFGPVALPFTFSLYGTNYTQVWINTNGNLTFTGPYGVYSASGFPFNVPMVAPFWADVDTRPTASGLIYYKVNPTNMIVTWDRVGYYANHTEKTNTFQVIIGTNNDPLIGLGQNVCFHYGDMQWTTGDASGGVSGFGGTPATVGINQGNGTNYVQIGRFNVNSAVYDGPGGNNDGINYLDDQCTCFNVSNSGNIPPVASNFPPGNVLNVACGQTINLSLQFIAPEVNQSVSTVVNTGGLCNTTANVVNGTTSTVNLSITGAPCNQGTHTITFTATDNGTPNASVTEVLTVIVGNCCTLSGSLTSVTNVSCPGGSNGAVDISVAGANGAVSYLWSNGATTQDLSGVPAGTYSVTITDGLGCTANVSATVGQSPDVTPPSITCPTNTTVQCVYSVPVPNPATASATDNCGVASVVFVGDASNGGPACNGAPRVIQRTYRATDGSGNIANCVQTITVEPAPLALSGSVTNASCFGGNDGAIDLSVSSTCPTYTYSWSNGATSEDVSGLGAGTYSVTVTDANGCSNSASFTVTEPAQVTATLDCCADTFACIGDTISLPIALGGSGPWNITYTNGLGSTTVTATSSPYLLSLVVTSTTTIALTGVSGNTGCNGVACGTVTIGANMCASTDSVAKYKFAICHVPPGNPGNAHTLYLPAPAIPAHLGHGDFLGTCDGNGPDTLIVWEAAEDDGCADLCLNTGVLNVVDNGNCRTVTLEVACDTTCFAEAKVELCHIPPGNPGNAHTIHVGASAVPAHLGHGDVLGPCPGSGSGSGSGSGNGNGNGNGNGGPGRVTICHIPPGNPANAHEITISVNALPAHLQHGDVVGPCPSQPAAPRSFVDISIPCGTVTSVSNSLGLPTAIISNDTTSGITGIRVWDLPACDANTAPFTITYEACSNGCGNGAFCVPLVAYGVGNCLQYEEAVMGAVSGNRIGQGGGGDNSIEMLVFPNPTSNSVTVVATCVNCTGDGMYQLNIIDAMGRRVMSDRMGLNAQAYTRTFDLSQMADGMYMVVITDGTRHMVQHVVKQH